MVTSNESAAVRATVFIATSLDGFIAREDGGIDWLTSAGGPAGEDYGYSEFFASVDALVMGRNTYELVRTFGKWPYGGKQVVVVTSREVELPPPPARAERMRADPQEVVRQLGERGVRHIYVDGGKTIQGFLAAGLIQRLIISRIPVLLGRGIPLFGEVPADIRLQHVGTRAFESGLVQSEYLVA